MRNGFSFIELLAVLVIISILSAIVYPGYQNYIVRAHRSDGQTALLNLANQMEHYYFQNNTYQTATIGRGQNTDVLNESSSSENWYSLSIPSATDSDYTLQATPRGAQAISDTHCQSLTLDSAGKKGITTGPAGTPLGTATQCW